MHVIRADEQLADDADRLGAMAAGLETPMDARARRATGNGHAPYGAPEAAGAGEA